jgi:glyceraldehyde-3-phosphate dehydrogenase (NADP+)
MTLRDSVRAMPFIAGTWRDDVPLIPVEDSDDGQVIGMHGWCSAIHAQEALQAAKQALHPVSATSPNLRSHVLRQTASAIARDAERLARVLSMEGIKTIREARAEVARCCRTLSLCADLVHHLHGNNIALYRGDNATPANAVWTMQATGTVLAITPFNDPLNLVAHKLGPAIAVGAPVILKPHESTPLSAALLLQYLLEAGMHPLQVQLVPGDGKIIANAIKQDSSIRVISFTGGRLAAENLALNCGIKGMLFETGGICPTVVMDDADIEHAANRIVSGAFWAAGQNCVHVQRVFAQKNIYSRLRELLISKTRLLSLGLKATETTDMGPLRNQNACETAHLAVTASITMGARLLVGGSFDKHHYEPTWLEDVCEGMPVIDQEMFAPISTLEPFENIDEVVNCLSKTDGCLQAGIFTQTQAHIQALYQNLKAGALLVNESSDYRDDAMPFGGPGHAGLGREGVAFAAKAYAEPKMLAFM